MSDITTPPAGGDGGGGGEPPTTDDAPQGPGIEPIEIQEEMERSFLDYSMSVIVSRALPDARDGLKPVHRRILWGMDELNARPDRAHIKSARVTGHVMGNYHPHGNQAIYDALARMAQDFSLRHPLIDGHGNFGSPDDPPAAERYTECRLAPLAMQMLAGIDENTVDMVANYDGKNEEPAVLPARFPNLLVNGSQGIAVGMATNIPPHNLREVIDAVVHLIDNPQATVDDLMQFVKGPDFPTGGIIMGRAGIVDAYRTGRGSIRMRATATIEEGRNGDRIVVTEMPYQTSVGATAAKIAELVNNREIDGIRAVNDESAKGKTRLVIDLKRDAPANVILNNLYKRTPLQTTFAVNTVALVDGVPRTLNLVQALQAYIDHQADVIRRRSEHRLERARKRAHILEGLIRALDVIDEIIAIVRNSDDAAAAKASLMADPFGFTDEQATYILDMPLRRLTRLARIELEQELGELRATIDELEGILADRTRLFGVIKSELIEVRDAYADDRRTRIELDSGDFDIEDLIEDEDLVFTMSQSGYVKTMAADEFRTQGRGGRGVSGANLKDEDYIVHLIHTSAHAYLLFFSNRGRVYRLKAHEIPLAGRTARGTAIVNLLPLQQGERIQAVIDTRDYETNRYLFFATRRGRVKKTRFNEYDSSLKAGLIAIKLNDDDELVSVIPTNGNDDVLLVSRSGQTLRFNENDVRPMGRAAAGVTGMRFRGDDELVSCDVAKPDGTLFIVTSAGFGKRTPVDRYPTKGRGGLGVIGIRITETRGTVAAAFMVHERDEVFLVASGGVIIRIPVASVSVQGRDATGVRVMNLSEGQYVAAAALVRERENGDDNGDAANGRNGDAEAAATPSDEAAAPAEPEPPVGDG
ncbi:MAG TPA: DNA gyrase subunit A [Acidimicrobiales bacterium]